MTKRPRQYAYEIIMEPSKVKRVEMLNAVPAEYKEWVEHLVRDHFAKQRKHYRGRKHSNNRD